MRPTPILAPYISGYLDVDIPADSPARTGDWLPQRVSPPGGAGLTFRWSGEVVLFRDETPVPVPRMAFTGPLSVAGETGCRGHVRMFSIVFTATGAHALFGLDMQRFADTTVDAAAVLPDWVRLLAGPLSEAQTTAERCAVVDAALRARIPSAREADIAEQLVQWLTEHPGRPLTEFSRALGVSDRTLRRHCLRAIGLSPKRFARVARFTQTQAFFAIDSSATWADAVQAFGYADQAHLIREFKHFAGQPPTRIGHTDRVYDPIRVRNLQDTARRAS